MDWDAMMPEAEVVADLLLSDFKLEDISSEEILEKLIQAGVDVFRLNFSHGDHAAHKQSIQRIRKVSRRLARAMGGDLVVDQGFRVGTQFVLTVPAV